MYKTLNFLIKVSDAEKALDFYNRAFGAVVSMKLLDESGRVDHAEMVIDDTVIMLKEVSDPSGSGAVLQLTTADVEGLFERALKAGAKQLTKNLIDPFGYEWMIVPNIENKTLRTPSSDNNPTP